MPVVTAQIVKHNNYFGIFFLKRFAFVTPPMSWTAINVGALILDYDFPFFERFATDAAFISLFEFEFFLFTQMWCYRFERK